MCTAYKPCLKILQILHLPQKRTLCATKIKRLKFSNSQTAVIQVYSCHHNSNDLQFPLFVHAWLLSAIHSLQLFMPDI
jgi:ligand-binding sensor protein